MSKNKKSINKFGQQKIINKGEKNNIFVACFPKSGSTYLTTLLAEVMDFKKIPAIQRNKGNYFWFNEQDINERQLNRISKIDSVTQQHTKATKNNIELLLKYNIKPVVLVRNIYDVLLSHYDHVENDDHHQPVGFIHKEYFSLSYNEKMRFLIEMHLPWYFNFFLSWREVSNDMETLWVTYEQLFADQEKTIQRILGYYSLDANPDRILSALQIVKEENTRFNKGIIGRGKELAAEHKSEIINKAKACNIEQEAFEIIGLSVSS